MLTPHTDPLGYTYTPVTGFEVTALEGRDQITLVLNNQAFTLPASAARVLAKDIAQATVRAAGRAAGQR